MKALCDTLGYEGYAATGFTSAKRALEALRERAIRPAAHRPDDAGDGRHRSC